MYDQGFSPEEICLEMQASGRGVTLGRVKQTIKQSTNKGMDSRRIFEIHEMLLEALPLIRQLVGVVMAHPVATAIAKREFSIVSQKLEKEELPAKIGAAMDAVRSADKD